MRAGDYVRCLFPFREVRGPGPTPHIVLVLALRGPESARVAFVAYTTTNVKFSGQRRPRQQILVDEEHARALKQSKPFVIDAMRVAKLPVTVEFFPDLRNDRAPNFGRDPVALQRVAARANELSREGWRVDLVDLTPSPGPKAGP